MQFANLDLFYLLLLVPIALIISVWRVRRRREILGKLGVDKLLEKIYPQARFEQREELIRSLCLTGAIALLVVALMRPQLGFSWKEGDRRGLDLVIALDVSESMRATDVLPSRLERARREVLDLLEHERGDRVALVAFAGVAFTEIPLTLDYGTIVHFLQFLDTDLIPVQGTNIKAALEKSLSALGVVSDVEGERKVTSAGQKAVIVITDGEDQTGDFAEIKKIAEKAQVSLFIIGVGTKEGAPIPLPQGGLKRDKKGNLVNSRLNEAALAELAQATGGVFVNSLGTDADTRAIYDMGIRKLLEDQDLGKSKLRTWNEYFQLPLFLALILVLLPNFRTASLESLRAIAKNKDREKFRSLMTLTMLLFLLLFKGNDLLAVEQAFADDVESRGSKALGSFLHGDYIEAKERFKEEPGGGSDFRFPMGEGASYYRLGQYQEALQSFNHAAEIANDGPAKAQALYNAGNSHTQLGNYQEAIKSYQESLKLNPNDLEAQSNLAYVKKLLQNQQSQSNQSSQDNQGQKGENKSNSQSKSEKSEADKDKDENNQSEQQESSDKSEASENKDQKDSDSGEKKKDGRNQDPQDQAESQANDQKNLEGEEDSKKEQQAQDEGKGEEEKDGQQGNSPPPEESSEQSAETPNEEPREDGSARSGKTNEGQEVQDQSESVLDSVEENKGAFLKYRIKQGLKELERSRSVFPEEDW